MKKKKMLASTSCSKIQKYNIYLSECACVKKKKKKRDERKGYNYSAYKLRSEDGRG